MMKKKVLFIGIGFYDYDTAISRQFKQLGYLVDYFCETPKGLKFRYYLRGSNNWQIGKIVRALNLNIVQKAASDYDYVFVIKGEYLSNEAIGLIKAKNPDAKWILYLWDSINRVPNFNIISYQFDAIYSFDRVDCIANNNLKFNALFFREEYNQSTQHENENIDIYFLGWYHTDRLKLLNKVRAFCDDNSLKYNLVVYAGIFSSLVHRITGGELSRNNRLLVYKPISIKANIQNILNSRCVLDIANPLQTGLTMRTIEVLGARKKIITTNEDIVNYDFYDPSNVMVINRDAPVLTIDFFKEPYKPVNNEIIQNYSLKSWLKKMIN